MPKSARKCRARSKSGCEYLMCASRRTRMVEGGIVAQTITKEAGLWCHSGARSYDTCQAAMRRLPLLCREEEQLGVGRGCYGCGNGAGFGPRRQDGDPSKPRSGVSMYIQSGRGECHSHYVRAATYSSRLHNCQNGILEACSIRDRRRRLLWRPRGKR